MNELIYYTNSSLKEFARKGQLKYYCLWLLLKKEFISGHFHSCKAPKWYDSSQPKFYKDLKQLEKLNLLTCLGYGKGFTLTSLKKVTRVKRSQFKPVGTIKNKDINKLLKYFIKEIVLLNYKGQLKNIVLKELGYTWQDTTISKECKRMYDKVYAAYAQTYAYLCTKRNAKNKTSLSVIGCGKLFGKGKWYGWKVMNDLIDNNIIKRFLYYTKVFVNYSCPSEVRELMRLNPTLKVYKGAFFKTTTCFCPVSNTLI